MELIEILVRLIIRAMRKASEGSPAEQARERYERQQVAVKVRKEIEARLQRELDARRGAAGGNKGRSMPPPPPAVKPKPRPSETAEPMKVETAHSRRPDASATTAGALAQWMRPNTLRSQFILTKVLRPPVSMRPPRY